MAESFIKVYFHITPHINRDKLHVHWSSSWPSTKLSTVQFSEMTLQGFPYARLLYATELNKYNIHLFPLYIHSILSISLKGQRKFQHGPWVQVCHMCGGQSSSSHVTLRGCPPLLRQAPSFACSSLMRLDWLASFLPTLSPQSGTTNAHHYAHLSMWALESTLRLHACRSALQ